MGADHAATPPGRTPTVGPEPGGTFSIDIVTASPSSSLSKTRRAAPNYPSETTSGKIEGITFDENGSVY